MNTIPIILFGISTFLMLLTGIGHRQDSRSRVLEVEVLVGELVSVDTAGESIKRNIRSNANFANLSYPHSNISPLSSCSVVVGEIPSLAHESAEDPPND